VVISQLWYKVGSSYEYSGITGVAHALEHMMFKGTEAHPAGEFSRIVSANGGEDNAFTGRDYTAYYQHLSEDRLEVSFALESDRMRNLRLTEEEFAKELQVIKEERRMRTEDNPHALTYEQFNATAFQTSPYRHPIIGWGDDLDHLTLADLKRWYATWYAPNNATLVVAGDVEPQQVLALAQKYFGPLAPSDIPKLKPRVEAEQLGIRRITVKTPAKLPYLLMGYQVPVVRTARESWEPYALAVLEAILDGGDSARLARELVRERRIAASAGASYNLYAGAEDLFVLTATPASGDSVEALEAALREQVEQLRTAPVEPTELARVKAQVVASKVYQQDSLFYQAMELGLLATVGLDWRLADSYEASIRAVTAEQVQEVAKRYLIDDRLTVAVLAPQPLHGRQVDESMTPLGGPHR
jgi:zinc protease